MWKLKILKQLLRSLRNQRVWIVTGVDVKDLDASILGTLTSNFVGIFPEQPSVEHRSRPVKS